MGSIRVRPDTATLFLDFVHEGKRVRHPLNVSDTPANRRSAMRLLTTIERKIAKGMFDYSEEFGKAPPGRDVGARKLDGGTSDAGGKCATRPAFELFAKDWYAEKEPEWRRSYRVTQRGTLDKHLIPEFGDKPIDEVSKADILTFRAALTRCAGRGSPTLSNRRVNAILKPLRQILNEAADRYGFPPAFRRIKPLKVRRTDVLPFTLAEAALLIESVRVDFSAYLTVRLFTGMRTGEINGLKWKYVDFAARLIYVRESLVLGEEDDVKTDSSHRDIVMSDIVFNALWKHRQQAKEGVEHVFCNTIGGPLDNKNFVNRVWKPLLAGVELAYRRPYQMRHTAATLWLASGEAPEWIARQLGHTTTEMLFRTYSRFVPNLTRKDGSAMDNLIRTALPLAGPTAGALVTSADQTGGLAAASPMPCERERNQVGQLHLEATSDPV